MSALNSDQDALRKFFDTRNFPNVRNRSDLFGVVALSLYIDEPDLDELVSDALTAGDNDKKLDFVYLDVESKRVVVGQSYLGDKWGKSAAPANKASDLNTAVGWLLNANMGIVPTALRQRVQEVREAICNNEIQQLHILYVHNCLETPAVGDELSVVAATARRSAPNHLHVSTLELGLPELSRRFAASDQQIAVGDELVLETNGSLFELAGGCWKAVSTTVSGAVLHDLFRKHEQRLFSSNIRSYLGTLERKRGNINKEIKATVEAIPDNFWVFNNGVTILTHEVSVAPDRRTLTVHGVSIINGAQTTGVLGSVDRGDAEKCLVACRFIECQDPEIVERIVRFNNTQNYIESFDYRSNDPIQRRLEREFQDAGIKYIRRRDDVRRHPLGSIHVKSAAQALASFHGEYNVATRSRSLIFEKEEVYNAVFTLDTSARHVYLVQCLVDALDQLKHEYRVQVEAEMATTLQEQVMSLLDLSTGKQFMVYVVGRAAEQILNRPVRNLTSWKVNTGWMLSDRSVLINAWRAAINVILPKTAKLVQDDMITAVRSAERAQEVASEVQIHLAESHSGDSKPLEQMRLLTTV